MPMERHDDLLEPEWERPRPSRTLTVVLAAALVFVLGFASGVLTQRALTPDTPTMITGGQGGGAPGGGVRRPLTR
jgi:hypothetical protein